MKDSELSSFSLPYIVSQQHFDAMPNEIYVLLLRNNEGEIIDEKNALDGVDFQIEAGQFIAIFVLKR